MFGLRFEALRGLMARREAARVQEVAQLRLDLVGKVEGILGNLPSRRIYLDSLQARELGWNEGFSDRVEVQVGKDDNSEYSLWISNRDFREGVVIDGKDVKFYESRVVFDNDDPTDESILQDQVSSLGEKRSKLKKWNRYAEYLQEI